MLRKPKSIICIEESSNDNTFLSKSAKNYKREIRVRSVSEMIDKVIRRLRGRLIQTLYIIGHGAPGYQSVGNGSVILLNDKSLIFQSESAKLYGESEAQLARLKGRFAPDGKLVLGGCRVAQGSSGRGLLKRVSVLLNNIAVEASQDKQFPPLGMEGIVIRAVGNSVCTVNSKSICEDTGDDL